MAENEWDDDMAWYGELEKEVEREAQDAKVEEEKSDDEETLYETGKNPSSNYKRNNY